MQQSNRELWMAFIAMIFITASYLLVLVIFKEIPGASDFYGHALGVLGFILMLATETLYSLRKRSRSARWGRMAAWLQFHIFTGLVGPFMVLLHSSWKFNGLAGITLLLTGVIVVSGFVGRYIYTAVPRGVDGAEVEARVLQAEIQKTNVELAGWLRGKGEAIQALAQRMARDPLEGSGGMVLLFSRGLFDLLNRLRWWWLRVNIEPAGRAQARQLEQLLRQRTRLQQQLVSLALVRRLLGAWRMLHIPIGVSLFVAAFIHMVAAVYYATLLR